MTESEMKEPNFIKDAKAGMVAGKPKRKRGLGLLLIVVAVCFALKGFLFSGTLQVEGKTRATEELEIKTLSEGILKEVRVENAQMVKKGELLFDFQNDRLAVDLIHAMQEKETLNQKLKLLQKLTEHSEKKVTSGKELVGNGVIGKLTFEELELDYSQNQEVLAEERRKLEEISLRVKALQNQKDALSVMAPSDGIFLGDLAQRKETYFKEGESLGVFFNPTEFYLEAFLPETKAKRVRLGDTTQVQFMAFGGSFKGKIIQIDEKATEEIEKVFKTKHVIRIRILLEKFPEGLRPGMRGSATILPAFDFKRGVK